MARPPLDILSVMLSLLLTLPLGLSPQDPLTWTRVESGSEASLRGLCAIDGVTAWASGAGGTVLRTTDGRTFERVAVPEEAAALDFRDVHAFDSERALILSAGSPTRMYRTEDGGANWELVYSNDDERAFFDAMDFWDESRGAAFSDPIDGRLLVILTQDGGKTWQQVPAQDLPESPVGEAGFAASGTCLDTYPGGALWIGLGGGARARLFRSLDYGVSWEAFETPLTAGSRSSGIFSVLQLEEGAGVIVGGDYTNPDASSGVCAVSDDLGKTWRVISQDGPSGYRSCVARTKRADQLVAVGPGGSDITRDRGATWSRFSDEGFHVASCGRDGAVWASGSDGRIARLTRAKPETDEQPPPDSEQATDGGWNRFRGPNGSGMALGSGYPEELGPDKNVRWKRAFPEGHSSPVLSPQHLFLTALEDEKLYVIAVERDTGETAWEQEVPRPRREYLHPKNHPASASVAVDHDTVVAFFGDYGLIGFDHAGNERFRQPLGKFDNIYGMAASPIIVDDVIVQACDQRSGSFVLGLSKRGEQLWRTPRRSASNGYSTPVVYRPSDGATQFLLPGSVLLDAYEVATGKRVWWVRGLPAELKSVPVLRDGVLYIHGYATPQNDKGKQIRLPAFADALAEFDKNADSLMGRAEMPDPRAGRVFKLCDWNKDNKLDEEEYESTRALLSATNAALAIKVGGEGDCTDSNTLWAYYRSVPQLPSPLVIGDRYWLLADQGGLLSTVSATTGRRGDRTRLVDGQDHYFAAPTAADGRVYLLSESGILSVLPAEGELEPLYTAEFGESCYASPAFADGQVWLRTSKTLYCFDQS